MFVRNKLWLGISAALVTSSAISAEPADGKEALAHPHHAAMSASAANAGAGFEGGEAGEGLDADVDITTNDVAYLTQLALVRGHLGVGVDLYRAGEHDAAATHMKHPESELYSDIVPGLKARNAEDFGEALSNLAKTVEGGGSVADADAAYEKLLAAISRAEAAAGEPKPEVLGGVILGLAQTAAKEFDIAVDDGLVVNAHEYQDAFGFIRVAQELTDQLAKISDQPDVVNEIRTQLDTVASVWPGVVPPKTLETKPSTLYGAAARIELAALSL